MDIEKMFDSMYTKGGLISDKEFLFRHNFIKNKKNYILMNLPNGLAKYIRIIIPLDINEYIEEHKFSGRFYKTMIPNKHNIDLINKHLNDILIYKINTHTDKYVYDVIDYFKKYAYIPDYDPKNTSVKNIKNLCKFNIYKSTVFKEFEDMDRDSFYLFMQLNNNIELLENYL